MSTLPIRTELTGLIAKEKNSCLLQVLRDIAPSPKTLWREGDLSGGSKHALLKAKLTSRAIKAEDALAHGRVLTTDQVRKRLAEGGGVKGLMRSRFCGRK